MRRAVDVQLVVVSCALLLASACSVSSKDDTDASPRVESTTQGLIFEQSLAITDQYTLRPFTLERVLSQIIQTGNASGVTPTSLFNQWWDTQNPGPGLGMGPHCDDETTNGQPSLNGYPWDCPRGEGYQAHVDPFEDPRDPLYWPVGLFNRFDLAPSDGSHCGEYRIAFAMKPDHKMAKGQNFIIFEAVLPNPNPQEGIRGCYGVAKFWYELSNITDRRHRLELLLKFYFGGWEEYPPVVHVDHYGTKVGAEGYGCSTGQIRTNQFVGSDYWNLREFRLVNDCRCDTCGLIVAPSTTKDNPFGEDFDGNFTHQQASDLQSLVRGSIWSLGAGSIHDISWRVEDRFNTGESVIRPHGPTDYLHHFDQGGGSQFATDLQQDVANAFGGWLDERDIVTRAGTQSCAGCHELSNGARLDQRGWMTWPSSLGFFHVGDWPINGSFPLSDAMLNDFLPRRAELLLQYIESGGERAPTEGKCEIRVPEELHVDCDEERERHERAQEEERRKREEEGREWTEKDIARVKQFIVGKRSFEPIGLEKLKPRLLPSLGGSRTH